MCFSPPSPKILRERGNADSWADNYLPCPIYESASTQAASIEGASGQVWRHQWTKFILHLLQVQERNSTNTIRVRHIIILTSRELHFCFHCGRPQHLANDKNCSAVGKIWNSCQKEGHFASVCNSRPDKHDKSGTIHGNPRRKLNNKLVNTVNICNNVLLRATMIYAFLVSNGNSSGSVALTVGDVKLDMLINSGASTNDIDHTIWENLKERKIKCQSKKCDKKLYACYDQTLNRCPYSWYCEVSPLRLLVATSTAMLNLS